MQKLVIALIFASNCAHADVVATAANNVGGTIALTDVTCGSERGFHAYTTSPTAPTQFGCWWSDDLMVHILWNSVEPRAYPLGSFSVDREKVQRMKKRNTY